MLSFDEFVDAIKNQVEFEFGEDFSIRFGRCIKNNGISLTGLIVMKNGESMCPTFYLEPMFEDYKHGEKDIEGLACGIYELYWQTVNCGTPNVTAEQISDFSYVKDKIIMRIINRDQNEELLKDVPYTEFLDLAVVYYIYFGSSKEGQMTALIHDRHMRLWGVSIEILHELAKKNTRRILPPKIEKMDSVMQRMMLASGIEYPSVEDYSTNLFILSNDKCLNGAVNILYPEILEILSEKFGGDFVILPSSLHECLITDVRGDTSLNELSEMVSTINATAVLEDDVLSNHVYVYDRDLHQIVLPKDYHCMNDNVAAVEVECF